MTEPTLSGIIIKIMYTRCTLSTHTTYNVLISRRQVFAKMCTHENQSVVLCMAKASVCLFMYVFVVAAVAASNSDQQTKNTHLQHSEHLWRFAITTPSTLNRLNIQKNHAACANMISRRCVCVCVCQTIPRAVRANSCRARETPLYSPPAAALQLFVVYQKCLRSSYTQAHTHMKHSGTRNISACVAWTRYIFLVAGWGGCCRVGLWFSLSPCILLLYNV